MKYLKKFNESVNDDLKGVIDTIKNTNFTPKEIEGLPLSSIYKIIVVKTMDPIDTSNLIELRNNIPPINVMLDARHAASTDQTNSGLINRKYQTNWIVLNCFFADSLEFRIFPDATSIDSWLKRQSIITTTSKGRSFEEYPIIGYNDVNQPEIENIFAEYGITVDEIWGIPKSDGNEPRRIEF
jgi:hypothetical protein